MRQKVKDEVIEVGQRALDERKAEIERLQSELQAALEDAESLRAELEATKINLVAYGDEIIRLQKLRNYYEELYTDTLRDSKAIEDACVSYHDILKSIADSLNAHLPPLPTTRLKGKPS